MILVNVNDGTVHKEIFRYKEQTGRNGNDKSAWQRSTSYAGEIATLKVSFDPKKFTLDISSLGEDENFTLVKEEKNGVLTLLFATKQGYSIEKVVNGSETICAINGDFRSFLCEYHSKGDSKLLRVHTEKDFKVSLSWYEKSSDKWNQMKPDDFLKKLNEMRGVPNPTPKSNITP
ncbi:hypothetical protein BEWA_044520 [Theileria equi strain WA]|uniref:Uncharacterized protein n=1 Tax=Theileria equi strain WA TaxID=1537102 RepID=L1LBA4_THEEQ|nr:hypothetical protein BEWA_044520 [Theileria equi strain WA]EKX72611.1 hypothetical protein BEWA_044520 [Theileria equi strain WA]|eukprot:XP_004832063.1 hypothetical protein BEWA_044520 [Theileria equi strain WA]